MIWRAFKMFEVAPRAMHINHIELNRSLLALLFLRRLLRCLCCALCSNPTKWWGSIHWEVFLILKSSYSFYHGFWRRFHIDPSTSNFRPLWVSLRYSWPLSYLNSRTPKARFFLLFISRKTWLTMSMTFRWFGRPCISHVHEDSSQTHNQVYPRLRLLHN